MPSYSSNDIVLVRYPFTDLSGAKVRPAVVINALQISNDIFIVPLTSKTNNLLNGEFVLSEWQKSGLNVETAVKRGIFTINQTLISKSIGKLEQIDAETLEKSLRLWLGLK